MRFWKKPSLNPHRKTDSLRKPGRLPRQGAFLLLALGLGAFGAVLFLEILVRVVRPFDWDPAMFTTHPRRGEFYSANYRGSFRGVTVWTDEFGQRIPTQYSRPFDPEKKGEPLLMAFGDSFTFGDDWPAEDSYVEQFWRLSRERGTPWQVMNAGVCGYGPLKVADYIGEAVPQWKPKVAVFQFFLGNDLIPQIDPAKRGLLYRIFSKTIRDNFLLYRVGLDIWLGGPDSMTAAWVRKKTGWPKERVSLLKTKKSKAETLEEIRRLHEPMIHEWKNQGLGWLQYREAVQRAAKDCRGNSIQMIGLILPINLDPSLRDDSWEKSLSYHEVWEGVGPLYEALENEFKDFGIPIINMLKIWALEDKNLRDLEEGGKGHFGKIKNNSIAEQLIHMTSKSANSKNFP